MGKYIVISTVLVLVLGSMVFAQQSAQNANKASATGAATSAAETTASVKIDGNNISVKYSAPSMNGRKIFGAVVPFDKIWHVGDKSATAFHTDVDLVFKGVNLKKGDYAVFVLPGAEKWQLIFAKPAALQSQTLDPKLEVGRATMVLNKSAAAVETCKLTLTKTATVAGKLDLAWENMVATATFYIDKVGSHWEW
jgi:hypothetical protein